ncbi:hypothetical protein GO730_04115 [Spirosoma sp. HMF3257]|uniref:DUF4332 domain-containing protein n=1 Tax=Spirosoma telluris TaxID=2183553 RepID=A0A327NIE1_9BACT|nr:hypothetical protein [Spirosoma telluris]RAI73786.1 hypothetical protein HMF3257_04070 [Spirosoma telluris]
MFELNPYNLFSVKIIHLIMGLVSLLLGFIIGYISRRRLVDQLDQKLTSTKRKLVDCKLKVNDESLVLHRIRSRAGEINFSRISNALVSEADDLKDIIGIGPFLEKRLHAIGIYTFRQIANFNQEDIEKINDIIEYFPGRIERDHWVSQAAILAQKK